MSREKFRRAQLISMLSLAGLAAIILAIRIAGPSDIADAEQPTTVSCMLDVSENNAWLLQRMAGGRWATKPPLLHWLGGLSVRCFGANEIAFKLPSMLAFLISALAIVRIGRLTLNMQVGVLAAAIWMANPLVARLAYIARPDMLLNACLIVGVLGSLEQLRCWKRGNSASPWMIVMFWLAFWGAIMTKGPIAFLLVLWFLGALVVARPGLRMRPGWQCFGLLFSLGLAGAWLYAATETYPDWLPTIKREAVERMTGEGAFASRRSSKFNGLIYALWRFVPWTAMFLMGIVILIADGGRRYARRLWPLGWFTLVIGVFLLPRTVRHDHLLPAFVAEAVVAGQALWYAQRVPGGHRVLAIVFLVAVLGLNLIAPILQAFGTPPPTVTIESGIEQLSVPDFTAFLWCCASLSCCLAIWGFYRLKQGDLRAAVLITALALPGLFGLNNVYFSNQRREPYGETVLAINRYLRQSHPEASITFLEMGTLVMPCLLGKHQIEDPAPSEWPEEGILVVATPAWERVHAHYPSRLKLLVETKRLSKTRGSIRVYELLSSD